MHSRKKIDIADRGVEKAVGLASAALYAGVGTAMSFINKYTLQIFPLPNTVLLLQVKTASQALIGLDAFNA